MQRSYFVQKIKPASSYLHYKHNLESQRSLVISCVLVSSRQKGFDPSSGMRALGILLHVCRHVDMYGFRGVEGFRAWYWDKYPGYKVSSYVPDEGSALLFG